MRIAASTDSSVVLPQPDAPRSNTSCPLDASRSSPSIGRTGVAARRVLDDEVAHLQFGVHEVQRSSEGQCRVDGDGAAQRDERGEEADGDRDDGQRDVCRRRHLTGIENDGPSTSETMSAVARRTVRAVACTARPHNSVRLVTPVALNTAKSRVRSIACRYRTEPMIPAAIAHSRYVMTLIVDVALFIGRPRSVFTSALVSARNPGGNEVGDPRTTIAVASGAPANPPFWRSPSVANAAGVPAKYVSPVVRPTTVNFCPTSVTSRRASTRGSCRRRGRRSARTPWPSTIFGATIPPA